MTPIRTPYPQLPRAILSRPQQTPALLDAATQICLGVLAQISGPRARWVRLHPTAACATQLKHLGFTDNPQAVWSTLAATGQVDLHPTLPFHYARLTRLGRAQAKHPSPHTFTAAPPHYQTILCQLYPLIFSTDAQQEEARSWNDIRMRYPLQWVVLEITQSHIEGTFLLPDELRLWASFETYDDALTYFQSISPAPTVILAHTLLTSLVLQHLPIPPKPPP